MTSALNILVLDNNPEGTQAIVDFLASARPLWTVDAVHSLSEARAAMESKHYDVYLLDFDLSTQAMSSAPTGDSLLPEIVDMARKHGRKSVALIVTGADAGWQYDRTERLRRQAMNRNIDEAGVPVNIIRKGQNWAEKLPGAIEGMFRSQEREGHPASRKIHNLINSPWGAFFFGGPLTKH